MQLTIFNEIDFLPALKNFFGKLNVPINYLDDKPTSAEKILQKTYKENESFKLINDVYFVGVVDDAAFRGNQSLALDKIKSDYDGILILGITLTERKNSLLPTRSQLAEIARAFNREFFYTPVVVVFKYGEYLAFANTERLKYKDNREGEKAGKVTLLRDIDIRPRQLHSGHQRILANLAILTTGKNKVDSFDSLYKYWQEVLSVSLLNKKFYQDLSNWYFWAVGRVTFPSEPDLLEAKAKKVSLEDLKQEHKSKNVIRLLTRLLFVWFIKEKGLIPPEFFELDDLQSDILKDISPYTNVGWFKQVNQESIYYKAILQNLFFATLNCPIKSMESHDNRVRGFRKMDNYGQHRDANFLMRYREHFQNPERFVEMVNGVVPFLNGGLFECLDDKLNQVFIDGFSDNLPKTEQLIVPDYLFFGAEDKVDLSAEYGATNKGTKEAAVKGLINILKAYKFTITENTPIEEDVALDPELLGKVFENLLASYNPETKTTARKQTGSFYTPREIVNYMVDESLIAYLKNKLLAQELAYEEEDLDRRLRQLVSFDAVNPFERNAEVQKQIIKALDKCTILDPACGSGAFPMGILQKMVHILFKVDPKNTEWKQRQIARVEAAISQLEELDDAQYREQSIQDLNAQIKDIEEAFDNNELDYGRKLYLIENCIYGVDIQSIATQISKLRFFISLVVDQRIDPSKDNFGIRPLPNLETKFVAANTLIGIEKPKAQLSLFDTPEIKKLEADLKKVRHRLFSSKSPNHKRQLREQDKALREQIAVVLQKNGWGTDTAKQLANWNPYNLNDSAGFFDSEWMFDISDGFDIVIGNPPYIGERKNKHVFLPIQQSSSKKYYLGRMDYFYFFFHLALDFLSENGHCCFITTNYFITALGARKLRDDLKNRSQLRLIVNFNEAKVFDSAAGQHNIITLLCKTTQAKNLRIKLNNSQGLISEKQLKSFLESEVYDEIEFYNIWDGEENYIRISGNSGEKGISMILKVIQEKSTDLLGNICKPLIGLESSLDDVYVKNNEFFKSIIENEAEMEYIKPFFKNSDIDRYKIRKSTNRSILYLHEKITNIKELSGIYKYLLKYETEIRARQGANLRGAFKRGNWWVLNTPRLDMDFSDEKIVTPYRSKSNTFAYSEDPWYASRDVYYIIKQKKGIELKYILALLNSRLYFHWFYHRGKRKGETLELYATPLKEVPIYEADIRIQILIATLVSIINILAESSKNIHLIDSVIEGCVINLYFPDHMKERGIDLLEFVEQDMHEIIQGREFEKLTDTEKEQVIEQLHAKWTAPDNEVRDRIKLFAVRSPDILKPILESK